MIGDRLQRLARALVREETYSAIVAPAIADLQYESQTGSYSRLRARAGVWGAIAGGLIDELRIDAAHTFTRSQMPRAAAIVCATLAVIMAIHLWVFSWNWGFRPQDEQLLLLLLLPALVVSAWPALMLPAAATLAKSRSTGTVRIIVLAGCVSALMMVACLDQGVTRTNQYFRQLSYERDGRIGVVQSGVRERPLSDLAGRNDWHSRTEFHFRLAFCASGIGWALIGLSLARFRAAALVGIGVVAHALQLMPIPLLTSGVRGVKAPVWGAWLVALILLIVGVTALRANHRNQHPPEPAS